MNTNDVADSIGAVLVAIHARTTRNKSPQTPINPYVVFRLDSALPTTPSTDYYLNVDVYDAPSVSSRAIETLADTIQDELNKKLINTAAINLYLALEQRQFISNSDLVESQMVNLRFVIRTYFK